MVSIFVSSVVFVCCCFSSLCFSSLLVNLPQPRMNRVIINHKHTAPENKNKNLRQWLRSRRNLYS